MKRIVLILLLVLPIVVCAKKKDDSHYLKGAVPEVNGQVEFHKYFRIKGMTDDQLYKSMLSYVRDTLVGESMHDAYARMLESNDQERLIVARCEEWLIFKKMWLSLDETRLRYQINITVKDNTVDMTINQISYLYGEEFVENKPTGKGGDRYRAEEWITDKYALNKAGTKLLPISAKFRRKTVDRMEDIFDKAMDMFEVKLQKAAEAKKPKKVEKKRKFVEE